MLLNCSIAPCSTRDTGRAELQARARNANIRAKPGSGGFIGCYPYKYGFRFREQTCRHNPNRACKRVNSMARSPVFEVRQPPNAVRWRCRTLPTSSARTYTSG